MDAVRRRFGIFVYDLVGAIIGVSGDGKSTLTNRLCNTPDVSPDAAPIGVVECTTEPSVYFNAECPRFKIMDNPGIGTRDQGVDFDKYAEKHVIEVADFYLAVMSDRVLDFFPAFQSWCHKRAKPFAVVRTKAHDSVKTLMKMHNVDQRTAFRMLKQATYDDLERNGIEGVKLFLVDNYKWEKAILAYNKGDHSNAVTPYDEGKLMKFVAKASLARYSLAKSASEFLGELCKRTTTGGDSGQEDDDAPQGDDIETMTLTTHGAAQAHATQSTDLPSIQSTECQTDVPNRRSRGPTDSPSVC
ncbi:g1060 [Coccomyxa elongata]